jgi:hypothetical protein
MLLVLGTAEIFTPVIEGAAAAIGSGVVLGSFGGASVGVLNGLSRRQVEDNGLRDGYFGASIALMFWLLDQCIVYATWI